MEEKIQNPDTGHYVKIGSKKYFEIIDKYGDEYDFVRGEEKKPTAKTHAKPDDFYKNINVYDIVDEKWSRPKRGRPRNTLRDNCGEKCFFGTNLGFPVCNACKNAHCRGEGKINRNGLQAAYMWARSAASQIPSESASYNKIAHEARDLRDEYDVVVAGRPMIVERKKSRKRRKSTRLKKKSKANSRNRLY